MTPFAELHPATRPSHAAPLLLLHGGGVANWMWEPQVGAFADRLVVTPDFPGFGTRTPEPMPDLPDVVDGVAARLSALRVDGPVDVVGLSLGGVVALHLGARHPHLVRTLFVSGAMVGEPGPLVRATATVQLAFWNQAWFWKAQASAFRLPIEARGRYVEHGLSVSRDSAQRMFDTVIGGGMPPGLTRVTAPVLAVIGEREPRSARTSLHALREAMPHAEVGMVPRMRHIWNVQDVGLFNQITRDWLEGRVRPRLIPV